MITPRNKNLDSANTDLYAALPIEEKEHFHKSSSIYGASQLNNKLEDEAGSKAFVEEYAASNIDVTCMLIEGNNSVEAYKEWDFNLKKSGDSYRIISIEEDLSWMAESNFKEKIPTTLIYPYEESGWNLRQDHELDI